MKTTYLAAVMAFSSLAAGCTNVAGDLIRTIEPLDDNGSGAFAYARNYFAARGYECHAQEDAMRLRCSRELRDLIIHQTRTVVELFPEGNEGTGLLLISTRWDEGLIPGEFISSEFHNPDVVGLCSEMRDHALGVCQLQEEH